MHDVVSGQNFEGFDDLPEVNETLFFGEGSLLLHKFIEGASVAELVDEVEVVGGLEHVDVFDDVGAGLEGGEDVDLVDGAFLQLGDLSEFLGLDDLDGHFLFGYHVNCLVNFGVDSLS